MPSYEERSRLIKSLSEQQYFDAQIKNDRGENMQILAPDGQTGRYLVARSDGGVTSNGDKFFDAAPPNDRFVRGTVNGNAISLDHRNIRQRDVVRALDDVASSNIILLLVSAEGTELFVAGDRPDPQSIFAPECTSISGQITKTGLGVDDWIVTGGYAKNIVIDGSNVYRGVQFTLTNDEVKEEEFALQTINSEFYANDKIFQAGEEVYLNGSNTKYYFSHYESIGGGFKVFIRNSPSSTPYQIVQPTTISLKLRKTQGTGGTVPVAYDRGYGWLDTFYPNTSYSLDFISSFVFAKKAVIYGKVLFRTSGTSPSNKVFLQTDYGLDPIRFIFWKEATTPLPSPLVEGTIYKALRVELGGDGTGYELYLNDVLVTIGSYASTKLRVEVLPFVDNTSNLNFNYSALQLPEDDPYQSPIDTINFNNPAPKPIKLRLDKTNEIEDSIKTTYIVSNKNLLSSNSSSVGQVERDGAIYYYRDYILLAQSADQAYQLVAKLLILPSAYGVATNYEIEVQFYSKDEDGNIGYKVVGTLKSTEFSFNPAGFPMLSSDDQQILVNLLSLNGNLISPTNYMISFAFSTDGSATFETSPSVQWQKIDFTGALPISSTVEEVFLDVADGVYSFASVSAFVEG